MGHLYCAHCGQPAADGLCRVNWEEGGGGGRERRRWSRICSGGQEKAACMWARRKSSEAGSERGGAKKSSELRQAALAGQLARRGSGDLGYSPHLISTRLSGRRMRRTGRSLPRRGSCGGVEAEHVVVVAVAAKMTKVAGELSLLGLAGTCPLSTRTAPHTQRRTGSGSDRRRYQPRIGDGSPSWTKRALVEAASGSGSCSTWAWTWREGTPRKVAVCVWNVADVAVCTMLV